MANTIDWGKASVNNTIDYGQGAIDNTINWGKSQTLSPSGETNITGTPSTPSFQNLNSFSFDGVDDYFLGVGNYNELNGVSIATFSFWLKPQDNGFRILLHVPRNNTNANGQFLIYQRDGRIQMNIDSSSYYCATTNNTLILNQWQHIMICMNLPSTTEGKIFINGVDQTSTENWYNRTALSTSTGGLYIGEANNGYQSLFYGGMDEVAIWSGTDLRNDVATIYNNGEPTDLNNNGLTAPTTWQRMGEDATWNGATWTMTDVNGGYTNRSINMVEANRTTDVPPNPFANTLSTLFDGVDDRINLSSTITFSGEFSFNWWMKPQGYATNSKAYIWGRWGSNTDFLKLNNNSQLVLQIGGTSRTLNRISGGNTIDLNVWSQICLTRDSSNNIKAYVNGDLFASASASTTLRVQTIGRIINNGFGFLGHIDEVSFFNRELNSSEITTIYNGGLPSDVSSISGIIHWYRCGDGDTSPTLTDNGSASNDGTMTNFTTFSTDVPT